MKYCKSFVAALACTLLGGSAFAQEAEFDLSSQRSEAQDVFVIPGKKIDHQGIIINPTPQQMSVDRAASLDVSAGLVVIDKKKCFSGDLSFITPQKKGVKLTIDFGGKAAVRQGIKPLSGAYAMTIDKRGIRIMGYDERGAFYGLQTLRQLMESPIAGDGTLPYLTINDYPTLPNRGMVEGFYGAPWSHDVRVSLIDFCGRHKMNVYIYGPKDDPYHSCPNWRKPYPEKEAENIHSLVEACRRNRVDFVWAIHPGQDIKWNEEDYQNLVNKFNGMYELGVRHFAIHFDDISGEGTNPLKQTALLNRLTDEFVKVKGDVGPLTVCPTDYSKLWANPTEKGSLAVYGRTLNPEIKVFWTGDAVCTDLTPETLDFINSRIKRPAYYWWNYPVTDYVRHILLQAPVYGLDTNLTANETCGVLSNPMEHGEASKLALYGVGDYTWNPRAYNAIDNWERALVELMPHCSEAYRAFAIQSCDTENGYRRDEAWETKTYTLANYDDAKAQRLEQVFEEAIEVPAILEKKCDNKQLLKELRPWLTEFNKLGQRGKKAVELTRMYRYGNDGEAFWRKFVSNKMSEADRKAYSAHRVGTMKLQPFYETAMDDMGFGFLKALSGEPPCDYRGIGTYSTVNTTQSKLMIDGDEVSHYTSGTGQKDGDWMGLDLRDVRKVNTIHILQGRNSKDDCDFYDHAALEYSADGKTWKTLIAEMTNQYVIDWKGEPVEARYIRLRRLDSKRKNWAAIREFVVNPVTAETLGNGLAASDTAAAVNAFDANLSTGYQLDGTMGWNVAEGTQSVTLLMNLLDQPIQIRQLDAAGKVVAETKTDTPFSQIAIAAGPVAKIEVTGKAEIFEVVVK